MKTITKNQRFIAHIIAFVSAFCLTFTLTGCGTAPSNDSAATNEQGIPAVNVDLTTSSAESQSANANYQWHEWTSEKAPNGYAVTGIANVIYSPESGEYVYTGLDELGRTQTAYACITVADYQRELIEERADFKSDASKISGWGANEKVTLTFPSGKTYNGYFYNRSHLIADSLGGSSARENLVTGSRFQNVGDNNGGGMGYAEAKARKWLSEQKDSDAYLYYAVTPVYNGDELVPRSVYVDMKSSDGQIDEQVEVFNVSGDPSYSIDYATGKIIR